MCSASTIDEFKEYGYLFELLSDGRTKVMFADDPKLAEVIFPQGRWEKITGRAISSAPFPTTVVPAPRSRRSACRVSEKDILGALRTLQKATVSEISAKIPGTTPSTIASHLTRMSKSAIVGTLPGRKRFRTYFLTAAGILSAKSYGFN